MFIILRPEKRAARHLKRNLRILHKRVTLAGERDDSVNVGRATELAPRCDHPVPSLLNLQQINAAMHAQSGLTCSYETTYPTR
jgi:hypothetical protein